LSNNGRHSEAFRQALGQLAGANIDRQMTSTREGVETHVTESLWESTASVIADEQYRLFRKRIQNMEWGRLAGSQQDCFRIIIRAVWHRSKS